MKQAPESISPAHSLIISLVNKKLESIEAIEMHYEISGDKEENIRDACEVVAKALRTRPEYIYNIYLKADRKE